MSQRTFLRYLLRRLLFAFVLVFLVSSGSLLLTHLAPGDATSELRRPGVSDETVALERSRLGLDRPFISQYIDWVVSVVRLDLGSSTRYGRPVSELLAERTRNTALLAGVALTVASVVGLWAGIVSASRPAGFARPLISGLSLVAVSVPPLLASLLLALFAARTGWFPVGGISSVGADGLDWLTRAMDVTWHLALPSLAVALPLAATIDRLQSQAMDEALGTAYVRAAVGRGIPWRRVVWGHALPVAIRPVLGVYGIILGSVFSGSFAVEIVTAWPGLGQLMYEALVSRDIYLVSGCAIAGSLFLALGNLLSDVALLAVDPRLRSDLVVVNTCSVTATADHGARKLIRRISRLNPSVRIVATGCYASRAAGDLEALPGVAAVIPNRDKSALVPTLLRHPAVGDLTTAVRFGDGDGPCGDDIVPGASGRTTYTLRVQTGCDEACAYCIIPSTRGSGRSMPLERVLEEVDRIESDGFKEATLTGVHIGSYGRDLDPALTLSDLLEALDSHPTSLLFRISSLEPMDCDERIVNLVAQSDRFAPHFHLPLQNASDRLLQAMRRPYTLDVYRRLVSSIRERIPHAGIGSDMVVGFPGEQPEDVDVNLDYLTQSPLTYLHVFPYSDRPGTEATGMPGKVPKQRIRARARAIREKGAELAAGFRMSQLGSVRPALTIDGGRIAVTDNYLKVGIPPALPDNQRVRVRITSSGEPLTGELVGP